MEFVFHVIDTFTEDILAGFEDGSGIARLTE